MRVSCAPVVRPSCELKLVSSISTAVSCVSCRCPVKGFNTVTVLHQSCTPWYRCLIRQRALLVLSPQSFLVCGANRCPRCRQSQRCNTRCCVKETSDGFDLCSFRHPFHSVKVFTQTVVSRILCVETSPRVRFVDQLPAPTRPDFGLVTATILSSHSCMSCGASSQSPPLAILVPTTYGFFVAYTLPARSYLSLRSPVEDALPVVVAAWSTP